MQSLWQKTASMPEFPSLDSDRKTDVLIIGGGICGILTAYFLHEKGIDYILVEKGKICDGTTAGTTAKLTFQHGLIYHKLFKKYGAEKAGAYLAANKKALEKYYELCGKIDCDFQIEDNYVYSVDDREKLENEAEALSKIGFKYSFAEKIPIPIDTVGAICFTRQAHFHPLKFLADLAENLNIYEHTFVREMKGNTAVTDKGKITAHSVIVATHFPFINKHGLFPLKLYQHRSYVLALENAVQPTGMYVDDDKKGLSFRNYGDLLLLGGGGHRTGKNGGNWNELRGFADCNYPQAQEVAFWAAQDCMSLDNMPYIGRYSSRVNRLYTASGFNKWGMTGAMLSAMLLSDAVAGRNNEYSYLFSPSRSMFNSQLLLNCTESALNMLSLSSKRCPHMGCALKWNSAEHSWDCPCHGSRFDENGILLDNPANRNLN